jgi:hypothetical protein
LTSLAALYPEAGTPFLLQSRAFFIAPNPDPVPAMAVGDNTDRWIRRLQQMLDEHRARYPDDERSDLDVLKGIMDYLVSAGLVTRDGERYVLPEFVERPRRRLRWGNERTWHVPRYVVGNDARGELGRRGGDADAAASRDSARVHGQRVPVPVVAARHVPGVRGDALARPL